MNRNNTMMITACENKIENDSCIFQSYNQTNIQGICKTRRSQLVCFPNNLPHINTNK